MRCNYLSIKALHPETLVNPFPEKCVVVAQRLSTFDKEKISPKLLKSKKKGLILYQSYLTKSKRGEGFIEV